MCGYVCRIFGGMVPVRMNRPLGDGAAGRVHYCVSLYSLKARRCMFMVSLCCHHHPSNPLKPSGIPCIIFEMHRHGAQNEPAFFILQFL